MSRSPRVIWLPEAVADLFRLRDFILGHHPDAPYRAVSRIKEAVKKVQTFPKIGRSVGFEGKQNIRDLFIPFGQNGYWLRYALTATEIKIVRIWHGREER